MQIACKTKAYSGMEHCNLFSLFYVTLHHVMQIMYLAFLGAEDEVSDIFVSIQSILTM